MFQTKEQNQAPEEILSEVKIRNLPNKEFKVMIIKLFQELRRRLDEQSKRLEAFKRVRKYKEEPKTDDDYNN